MTSEYEISRLHDNLLPSIGKMAEILLNCDVKYIKAEIAAYEIVTMLNRKVTFYISATDNERMPLTNTWISYLDVDDLSDNNIILEVGRSYVLEVVPSGRLRFTNDYDFDNKEIGKVTKMAVPKESLGQLIAVLGLHGNEHQKKEVEEFIKDPQSFFSNKREPEEVQRLSIPSGHNNLGELISSLYAIVHNQGSRHTPFGLTYRIVWDHQKGEYNMVIHKTT